MLAAIGGPELITLIFVVAFFGGWDSISQRLFEL